MIQPIFSRNNDYEKIAFLNWRIERESDIHNILNLADGYMLSAIELAKHCLENNEDKRADILVFPILANVNHGIELYLKALLWMLHELLTLDKKVDQTHNIKQLFQTFKARLKDYEGKQFSQTNFDESIKHLHNYIDELFQKINASNKDNKMDFSRYPFNSKYENHFYVEAIGNVEVDLENFVFRFTEIHNTFENISDHLFYNGLCQKDIS